MNHNKDNRNDEPHVKRHKKDKKVNGEKWVYGCNQPWNRKGSSYECFLLNI
jgi:hypothetical protein